GRTVIVRIFDPAVKNTAVARAPDLPFELELEIAELIARDEIANVPVLGECAVVDLPSRRHIVTLVGFPVLQRRPVEEDPPRSLLDLGAIACAGDESERRQAEAKSCRHDSTRLCA